MSLHSRIEFSNDVVIYPLLMVVFMWIAFWAEFRLGWDARELGIYPGRPSGLLGVVFGPFIHADLRHLFNNSVPLLVLGSALFFFYRNLRWRVLIIGTLATGLLTWIIGRPAMHIGASGVVYMLAAFLFFKGIFSRHFQLIALSLVVVFLYGSLLWYVFPIDPKISWEGHLSGFLVGFSLALVFRKVDIEYKRYDWERDDFNEEEDPFLRQFDEEGNFIGPPPPDRGEPEKNNTVVHYTIVPDKNEEPE